MPGLHSHAGTQRTLYSLQTGLGSSQVATQFGLEHSLKTNPFPQDGLVVGVVAVVGVVDVVVVHDANGIHTPFSSSTISSEQAQAGTHS